MPPKGKKKAAKAPPLPQQPLMSASASTSTTQVPKAASPAGAAAKRTPTLTHPTYKPGSIGEKQLQEYQASRPALTAWEEKGWDGLSAKEKERAPYEALREGPYRQLDEKEQAKFIAYCEKLGVEKPLVKPDYLGKDYLGRQIEDYSLAEYTVYEAERNRLRQLQSQSESFKRRFQRQREKEKQRTKEDKTAEREGARDPFALEQLSLHDPEESTDSEKEFFQKSSLTRIVVDEDIEEEKQRRVEMASLMHERNLGRYARDPLWDDVQPLPQEEDEKALAKIAYSSEYAEAISYLRRLMSTDEHSERALTLTAHIIDLNPAHYTVWLYRAAILVALNSDLHAELDWVNDVALDNQKNYQIWHHRQLLISTLYPTICASRTAVLDLAVSEIKFMTVMFERDSKNYHVWSYRQWLVRRLDIFPSQVKDQLQSGAPDELAAVKALLERDVRNNSAWSHRFFIIFSDPEICTEGSKATERDRKIPESIIEREVTFAEEKIRLAPQNQSGWNYMKGVLRKGGRSITGIEEFASEFVTLGDEEKVTSSHALDFLADVWAEKGEREKAATALKLLARKYDQVRKKYWEWRLEIM